VTLFDRAKVPCNLSLYLGKIQWLAMLFLCYTILTTNNRRIMISLTDYASPELTKAITDFEECNGSIARISRFINLFGLWVEDCLRNPDYFIAAAVANPNKPFTPIDRAEVVCTLFSQGNVTTGLQSAIDKLEARYHTIEDGDEIDSLLSALTLAIASESVRSEN